MSQIDKKLMSQYAKKYKNWGRWGVNDELGTLNFITPDIILEATKTVSSGKVFSLTIPFDENGPQNGHKKRYNPIRVMLTTLRDDLLIMPTHGATHWDALSHVFYEDEDAHGEKKTVMWNGYSSTLVDINGAEKCGIENTRDKMVGRGILLDIAKYKGCEVLEDGYGITNDDLNGCAEANKITIKQGDFVLIRTGKLGKCLKEGEWGNFIAGDAPGLEFETLEWLHNKEIAAIASDTYGIEVFPNRSEEFYQPWHQICIPILGLISGEMFNLDELATDCCEDGKYEFLLVAPTLPFTKGCGSPTNPIAIK